SRPPTSSVSTTRARSRGCSEAAPVPSRAARPKRARRASVRAPLIPARIGDGGADVLAALLAAAVVGVERLVPVRVGGAEGGHDADLGAPVAARLGLGQRLKA